MKIIIIAILILTSVSLNANNDIVIDSLNASKILFIKSHCNNLTDSPASSVTRNYLNYSKYITYKHLNFFSGLFRVDEPLFFQEFYNDKVGNQKWHLIVYSFSKKKKYYITEYYFKECKSSTEELVSYEMQSLLNNVKSITCSINGPGSSGLTISYIWFKSKIYINSVYIW